MVDREKDNRFLVWSRLFSVFHPISLAGNRKWKLQEVEEEEEEEESDRNSTPAALFLLLF